MKTSVLEQEATPRKAAAGPARHPNRAVTTRASSPAAAVQPVSFVKRFRWPLVFLAAAGIFWGFTSFSGSSPSKAPKAPPVRTVTIQPPPATPPPPPPPPPPPKAAPEQPKLIEQAPVNVEEPKPDEPKPADDSPPDPGTGIKGDGPPDGFGLSANRGNGGSGNGLKGSGGSRSHWGWYAAKVQSSISDALRRDPKLRDAVLSGKVRIWPDAAGRISRAKLDGSTGDTSLDAAVNQALTGLQLPEPPPADMPSPILLRVTARRP